jgi:succinoglycan biosynthesis transport protein ExoP
MPNGVFVPKRGKKAAPERRKKPSVGEKKIMQEREIHLLDYLTTLKKRKYWVVCVALLVFALNMVKIQRTVPVYRATTTVLIQKKEPPGLSMMNSYYFAWDPEFYQTQIQVIKSALIGEKVVEILKRSGAAPEPAKELKKPLLPWPGRKKRPSARKSLDTPGLSKAISGGLVVNLVKDSKILKISYSSSDREFAAAVANAAAQGYMEELMEMNVRSTRYAIQWLTDKSDEEEGKVRLAEKELRDYTKDADVIALDYRLKVIPEELSSLSVQLAEAETQRKELETVYRMVSGASEETGGLETILAVESDVTVKALKEQIIEAEKHLREQSKKYTAKHPTMLAAGRDLAMLQSRRRGEIQRVVESIRNEYEMARSKEDDLRRRIESVKEEAFSLKEKFVQYEVMKLEADTNKQFYDALLKRTKEYTINEQLQSIQVSVLERAEVPKRPVSPDKPKSILFGLMLAVFAGVGTAFFIEYLDHTVKSPEDLESKTGLPVLGLIPLLKEKDKHIEEVLLKDPGSLQGESYKALRTSVLLSSAEKPPKSILVTSMIPGEGKTSTAINLAVATALSEYKVLLVDCDLRKPQIHKRFGVKNIKGLSTYLAGVSDGDIIFPTPIKTLYVMAPGPVPPNPSELLSSRKMETFMEFLRERFDFLVFDSPPLLTVADSMVITRHLDATLVVTRAGRTTYEMLRRGLKSLSDINANILGTIINAHEENKSGYYSYYKYYQYYKAAEPSKTS